MVLSEIQVGDTCTVEKLNLPFQLEQRLQALGMTHQTAVSVLHKKGKGIMVIKLRGTRFALGEQITKQIEVTKA